MLKVVTKSPIWIIKLGNGKYAGSPLAVTAPNRNMAASFVREDEAVANARAIGNGATAERY